MRFKNLFFCVALLFSIFYNNYAMSQKLLGDVGKPNNYNKTLKSSFQMNMDRDVFFFPNNFDWRDYFVVSPAKHQGSMGSCWAFTSVGVMESKVEIERIKSFGDKWINFSEQQLINCMAFADIFGYGHSHSMTSLQFYFFDMPILETCAPYKEKEDNCFPLIKCKRQDIITTEYYTVDISNFNDIKSSLIEDGPAYFRFDVWKDFFDFWSNAKPGTVYVNKSNENSDSGHAVLIIGWDDDKKAWLCKNSWGRFSGPENNGTFWISYQDHLNNLNFGMANIKIIYNSMEFTNSLYVP